MSDLNQKSNLNKIPVIIALLSVIFAAPSFFEWANSKIFGEKSSEIIIDKSNLEIELQPSCFFGAVAPNTQSINEMSFLEAKSRIDDSLVHVGRVGVKIDFSIEGEGQYNIKNIHLENVREISEGPEYYITSYGGCGAAGDSSSVVKFDLDNGSLEYDDTTGRYEDIGNSEFINTSVHTGGNVSLNVLISSCKLNRELDLVVDYIDVKNPQEVLEYRINNIQIYNLRNMFEGSTVTYQLEGVGETSTYTIHDAQSASRGSCD